MIRDVGGWDMETATEDMSLGIDLYSHGYSLVVIDKYLQDICPEHLGAWLNQKKRWVSGPYDVLLDPQLTERERVRFAMSTLVNQMTSVVNTIRIPVGAIFVGFLLLGNPTPLSLPLLAIVTVNGLGWVIYTLLAYSATHQAVRTSGWIERLKFALLSNMVTQAMYAMLWAIPILLALRDHLLNREIRFEVTPK